MADTSTITVEVVRFETDIYRWSAQSGQLLVDKNQNTRFVPTLLGQTYRLSVSEFGQLQPLTIEVDKKRPVIIRVPVTKTVENQVPDSQGLRQVATCVRWDETSWVAFDRDARKRFCHEVGKK